MAEEKNRIKILLECIQRMLNGDLETEIVIDGADEIAEVSFVLDELRYTLKGMLDGADYLKKEELTKRQYLQNSVNNILDKVNKIAKGDLEVKIEAKKDDDEVIIALSDGINKMSNSLKNIIDKLKTIVLEITSSSSDISFTSEEIVVKANEEIKIVSEASSTISELTASINEVANNSENVYKNAEKTLNTVKQGWKYLEATINKMEKTTEIIDDTAKNLLQVQTQSQEIQGILEMINRISGKIDLLALNAAIEASAVSEEGRRFRVVADEMRKLADSSTKSSNQIGDVLTAIQQGIETAGSMMSTNVVEVNNIMKELNKTGDVMKEMVQVFNNTSNSMKEVSISTNQQAKATEMFNNVIKQVNVAASETVKGVEDAKLSIKKFIEISNNLKEISDKFNIIRNNA